MKDGVFKGETLTRADLAKKVYETAPLSRQEAAEITDAVIESVVNALAAGENVKIKNFATFIVHRKNARPGRNPKTLEDALVPARAVVLFRPSNALRKTINPQPDGAARVSETRKPEGRHAAKKHAAEKRAPVKRASALEPVS